MDTLKIKLTVDAAIRELDKLEQALDRNDQPRWVLSFTGPGARSIHLGP